MKKYHTLEAFIREDTVNIFNYMTNQVDEYDGDMTDLIYELNNQGYFISAVYELEDFNKQRYFFTKEISEI